MNTLIGQRLSEDEIKDMFKMIYGGVAWPGKKPGFAIIAGMSFDKRFGNYDIYVMDEFESADMRELVRQCDVLDYKYRPETWYGDGENDAADKFISELNIEIDGRKEEPAGTRYRSKNIFDEDPDYEPEYNRQLYICQTKILEMQYPYHYMLPRLKSLLNPDTKQLFLVGSKVPGHLKSIENAEDINEIVFGDYPAIEALSFVTEELRWYGQECDKPRRPRRPHSPMRMC